MTRAWGHNELAADLASHLLGNTDRLVWCDMQLGPSGNQRPDVYAMEKTYSRLDARVYEVKVSRADFLSDVTSGKWQGYLRWCNAVVFAVPEGLVKRDEVPAGCGLYVRRENGWKGVRKPTLQRLTELPTTVWQKLVFDGIQRAEGPKIAIRNQYLATERALKALGAEWGRAVRSRDNAVYRLEEEKKNLEKERAVVVEEIRSVQRRHLDEIRGEMDKVRAALDEAAASVGLPPGSASYQITSRLRELVKPDVAKAARELRLGLLHLRRDIKNAQDSIDLLIGEAS